MDSTAVLQALKAYLTPLLGGAPCRMEFITLNRPQEEIPSEGAFGLLLSDAQHPGAAYITEVIEITVQVVRMGETLEADDTKTSENSAWLMDKIRAWENDFNFPWGQMPASLQPTVSYQTNANPESPNYGYAERVVRFGLWRVRNEAYL